MLSCKAHSMAICSRLTTIAGLCLLMFCASAHAHKASDSYLQIDATGPQISIRWDIALRDLDAALDIDFSPPVTGSRGVAALAGDPGFAQVALIAEGKPGEHAFVQAILRQTLRGSLRRNRREPVAPLSDATDRRPPQAKICAAAGRKCADFGV